MDLSKINSLEDIEAKIEEFASKGDNQEYRYLLDKEIAEENKAKLSVEIAALEKEISEIDTDIPAEGLKNDAEIAARQEKINLKNEKTAALKELKDKVRAEERVVAGHDDKIIKKGITKELGQNILKVEDIERQIADLDKADPDAELPDATNAEKEAYREAIEKAKKELQEELQALKEKAEQEKVEIRRNAHTAYDYAINDRRDLRDERSAFFTQAKTKLENDKVAVEREMKLIELKADKYTSMTPEQLSEAKTEMAAKLENVTKAIASCQEQLDVIKVERDEEVKKYGLRSFQRRPDVTKPEGTKGDEGKGDEGKGDEGKGDEGKGGKGDLPAINGNEIYANSNFWEKYLLKKEAYTKIEGEEPTSVWTKARLLFRNPAFATKAAELISNGEIKLNNTEEVKETKSEEEKPKNPWEVKKEDLKPIEKKERKKETEERTMEK